jgi:hypothetical protein
MNGGGRGSGSRRQRTASLFACFASLILLARAASTQSFASGGAGTAAADFLEQGVGARAIAMGGAYSAVANDATALYWNAADLVGIQKRSLVLMHSQYLASTFYDYASYGQKLPSGGAFGLGFQYLNAGSISQTDANFNTIGSFSPYDLAVSAGYADTLKDVTDAPFLNGYAFGVAAKYVRSAILQAAQTGAVDLGVLSPFYFADRFRFALTAQNLGGTLHFEQGSESLPVILKAGSVVEITGNWIASADVGAPRDDAPYVAVGTEYVFPIKDQWTVAGRLGYNSETMPGIAGVTGASAGVGLGYKSLDVDYAVVPYGGLGLTNTVSVGFKF